MRVIANVRCHMRPWIGLALLLSATVGWTYDDDMVANALRNCTANQLTLKVCSWHRAELSEKKMQQAYSQLRSRLVGTPALPALESAQKGWLAYRAGECSYRISGLTPDGSMVPQVRDDCRRAVTDARTAELTKHLSCNAQGCPGQ